MQSCQRPKLWLFPKRTASVDSRFRLCRAGRKGESIRTGETAIKEYDNDTVSKPPAEVALAQIQAHFGDYDSAIAALPHLLQVPAGLTVANLKLDPLWDPIRKDPRFIKLISDNEPKK